ncbi:membrane bound O-acyl transferase family-domain-containing protein [Tuber brumale]|nr:membrane bound O-acyl transferase family-domain-containing protein [Tuber brumale]
MALQTPIPLPGPVISALLLPLFCILSLSLPPFPLRSALFVPLIVLLVIAVHASPADPTNPQLTYAIGTLWPLYLSALSQHLFLPAPPETLLYLRSDKPGEAATWGFSLRKIIWSAKLFFDQRGIRWNFRVKGAVPTANRKVGRWEFVFGRAVRGVLLAIGLDLCLELVAKGYRIPDTQGGGYLSTRDSGFVAKLAIAVVCFTGIELNHVFYSVVVVAAGLYEPEDWPPLFGSLTIVTSIRNFWGKFWHQLIRRTLTITSTSILTYLHLPSSYALVIALSFIISGFFHALPLLVMPPFSWSSVPRGILAFYFAQPVGILLETLVSSVYTGKSTMWTRMAGHIWVAVWLSYTAPWFWDDMFAVGIFDENFMPMPRVVRRLYSG